ncbi:SRPBCC family protein [Micromonospora chokoriensis]|uniref:SRPBCC family protein n=1 Tax=Micromonospora chokoriensis TaxID=356851 RepID=UPI00055C33F0|nr:SRPBCC family protein [Micromonospora chokoriensis]
MSTPPCATERSDSYSVSISAPVDFVWATLATVADWPRFSPFALRVRPESPGTFTVTSPTGDVRLTSHFDEALRLLDHTVTLADGTDVFIPYRVTPNHRGSELIMTNVKSPTDSAAEYEEQLGWMRTELANAKTYVEECYAARGEGASRAD